MTNKSTPITAEKTNVSIAENQKTEKTNTASNENQKAEKANAPVAQDQKTEKTNVPSAENSKETENNKLTRSQLEEVTKHHDVGDQEKVVQNPVKAKVTKA